MSAVGGSDVKDICNFESLLAYQRLRIFKLRKAHFNNFLAAQGIDHHIRLT